MTAAVRERQLDYRSVIARALADEMDADPRVVLLGADVATAGGVFQATAGLQQRFGNRVRDTPVAPQAIVGLAIGAALQGIRPVAEIIFAGGYVDQIVNSLAKYRYTTGGQASLPVTIRMANGAGAGFGPQLSQPAENWFLNVPGVKLVAPGTVEDLYGLIRSAAQDDDPVIVFEHKNLLSLRGAPGRRACPDPDRRRRCRADRPGRHDRRRSADAAPGPAGGGLPAAL